MTHPSLTLIRADHRRINEVLAAMIGLLAQLRESHALPDFKTLRAALFHMHRFVQDRHHQLETEVLFARMRARTPMARHVLDQLDEEHAWGERYISNLQYALLSFEMLGEPCRDAFEREMERYAHFYLSHMSTEEYQILPLAQQVLNDEDWTAIDAEFEASLAARANQPGNIDDARLLEEIASAMKVSANRVAP